MKRLLLLAFLINTAENIFPQTWQALLPAPGAGVTDMVHWNGGGVNFGDKLWVSTSSYNWPNGQWGGVFWNETFGLGGWHQVAGGYVARTLAVGQDGKLYASIWYDPAFQAADALCVFVPQVGIFSTLYQASAGDNIFSIAVKDTPHTIFAGTRNGVIRSTDNGVTFGYSNTGIPDSTWVYDIAIDSSGIIAIASSKGVFISTDNGDNWLTTTGISAEDMVTTLLFTNNPLSTISRKKIMSIQQDDWLYTGTHNGKLLRSFKENAYTTFVLTWLFADKEDEELSDVRRLASSVIMSVWEKTKKDTNGIQISKITDTGGIYESTDEGQTWNQINVGLPPEPPVSALAIKSINETSAELYAGLFNDTTNGAGVYKLSVTVGVEEVDNQIPSDYKLEQNYPNPFNPSTNFEFQVASLPDGKAGFGLVVLKVYDVLGKEIATIVNEELPVGRYSRQWEAEGLSSGVYFYRLSIENFTQTKKLLLMK
jgi:hypothetical protein